MGETVRDRALSRWRKEIEYDPLTTLSGVKAPALILYGAADPVVPVSELVQRLKETAAQHPRFDVVVVAGADHSMQLSVSPKDQMDPARADDGAPEAAEYFGALTSWLTRQGIAQGPGS